MSAYLPDGTWASEDGRWRLVGGRWRPLPPARPGPPGLFWFFSTPDWFGATLLMGLITFIPVVGLMNLYGWSLATAANLRAGYRVPAPAGLGYIRRGARYYAWGCVVGLLNFTLAATLGVGAGLLVYWARHDWAYGLAVGLSVTATVGAAQQFVLLPMSVPVLDLIDRRGFWTALAPAELLRTVRQHWDAAWYGALALIVYQAASVVISLVGQAVPLVGFLIGLAAIVPAYGALGLLLAAPLARVGDPPQTFNRTHTSLIVGGVGAWTALGVLAVWSVSLLLAFVVSSHPDEVGCTFRAGCAFSYSGNVGNVETVTDVHTESNEPSLAVAQVTFINHSSSPESIDPAEYWLSPSRDHATRISPSGCPAPEARTVAGNSRTTQSVCFRLPDPRASYDLHLPWTGWDYNTRY